MTNVDPVSLETKAEIYSLDPSALEEYKPTKAVKDEVKADPPAKEPLAGATSVVEEKPVESVNEESPENDCDHWHDYARTTDVVPESPETKEMPDTSKEEEAIASL